MEVALSTPTCRVRSATSGKIAIVRVVGLDILTAGVQEQKTNGLPWMSESSSGVSKRYFTIQTRRISLS